MTKILVVGGARSGKSRFAQQRAEAIGLAPIYIATAQAFDAEMADRIACHQQERDERWRTVEAPIELPHAIREWSRPDRVLLIDCLTLWLSNVLLSGQPVDPFTAKLSQSFEGANGPVILVSNEVGCGIVPENALARKFRDHAGHLNQKMARIAEEVNFIAAGLPLRMK